MAPRKLSINRPKPRNRGRIQSAIGSLQGPNLTPRPAPRAATPAPAAPAPAAAPPPAPSPMPWDTQYQTDVGSLDARYNNQMAQFKYQGDQTVKDYGFDDATDPYSNLKLLKQNFEQGKRRAGNQMASAGQLYSGAYQNAQNTETDQFNQGYAGLRKQYDAALNAIEQGKAAAQLERDEGLSSANYSRVQTAMANRPDPDELGPDPAAAAAQPAAAPSWKPKLKALRTKKKGRR